TLDTGTNGTANANDLINVQATLLGTTTTIKAGAGNDTINISSDAAQNGGNLVHAGNLAGIQGTLNLQAGSGRGNRLVRRDLGNSTTGHSVQVSASAISGFAPAPINYSTAGSFTDGAANDGILLLGPNTGVSSTYNVVSTLSGSTTKIDAGAGSNTVFNVGS